MKKEEIISTAQEVLNLCLLQAPKDFDSFESDFQLTIIKDCEVNGLLGWFEVEMTEGVLAPHHSKERPTGTRLSFL